MSRHEGVSCDSCLISNFRGRRYKCLICYDYDLCAACYEGGATNTRHTTDHPMQCLITRADFDLYFGGEALTSLELPQSYTCPYCARMGFTDSTLQEHVTSDHADTSFEVVCPLCAAIPGGDPNLMTDDFAGHLTLEHRTGPRDLISFLDEPVGTRHNVRRIPHNTTHLGRGAAALRPRRSNMHFSVFSSGGLSSLSPSSRGEPVDPIAELLSQLSGVRRTTGNSNTSTPTQLQQLQMQLQLERQQVNAARQQLERFPRRQTQSQNTLREPHATATSSSSNAGTSTLLLHSSPIVIQQPSSTASNASVTSPQSQFLLTGLLEELSLQTTSDTTKLDRCQFVQELVLSSIVHHDNNSGTNTMINNSDETNNEVDDEQQKSTNESKLKMFPNTNINRQAFIQQSDGISNELTTDEKPTQHRQGNIVLRGRARSDAQNARRRAEANRGATFDFNLIANSNTFNINNINNNDDNSNNNNNINNNGGASVNDETPSSTDETTITTTTTATGR